MPLSLSAVCREARACTRCRAFLPEKPKPIFLAKKTATLLIVGQAPGRRVHESGIPWNDPSGDRLRDWLGMDRGAFYDTRRVAIVPIGLCYPGTVDGADLPPRPECAPIWQPLFRGALTRISLTLLVGSFAQTYYLREKRKQSLAKTVRAFRQYLPEFFPLPHPSWRNSGWLKVNPWFERDVIPELRRCIMRALA